MEDFPLTVQKLKQREIATLLDIPQPKVSALKNYRLDQFSVERLMEFLTALNQDFVAESIVKKLNHLLPLPRGRVGVGELLKLGFKTQKNPPSAFTA
jgi:hypothetical protein